MVVYLCVVEVSCGAVHYELQKRGHNGLAALGYEEVLKVIVCKGRILDVDLAHYAHSYLLLAAERNGGEIVKDIPVHLLCPQVHPASLQEDIAQSPVPFCQHFLRVALVYLIGSALVVAGHEQIAVEHGIEHFQEHGRCYLEGSVLFQSAEVQGYHRYLGIVLCNCLSQQVYVI